MRKLLERRLISWSVSPRECNYSCVATEHYKRNRGRYILRFFVRDEGKHLVLLLLVRKMSLIESPFRRTPTVGFIESYRGTIMEFLRKGPRGNHVKLLRKDLRRVLGMVLGLAQGAWLEILRVRFKYILTSSVLRCKYWIVGFIYDVGNYP